MRQLVIIFFSLMLLASCTSVVNTFTNEPIQPDPTKKGVVSSINDIKMATYIGVNLKKADLRLDESHITVTVVNAIVLITGEVPTQALKTLAGKVARQYTGVRKVHNELQLRNNTTLISRTNDSLMGTQIKAKLVLDDSVDSSDVKVVVEDGTVYLMGTTRQENGNLAASIASNHSGVRKVVKVFEYID
jgi:osmotically-inducible protein OsmY